MTIDVTDATFQTDVIEKSTEVPVVVDLWAPWCGPCQTLGPIIERVVDATGGQVVLAKVNIDENPASPNTYGVRGIPTLILFKDGKPVETKVGAMPKSALKQWVAASV